MEYLYAAMLLHKAGQKINEEAMEKVLSAAGVKVDKARVKATVTALGDVDIDKTIAETNIAATSAPASAPAGEEKKEESKEEKKEEKEDSEKSEEEAAAGLGALFG